MTLPHNNIHLVGRHWASKLKKLMTTDKVRSLLEHGCAILISFKIVVIFNTTSAKSKQSHDHNFERNEDHATVF